MAIVTSYNAVASTHQRNITTESALNLGMRYTHNPLQEGYFRNLVNYSITPNGAALEPRAGMNGTLMSTIGITKSGIDQCVHHVAQALVMDYDEENAEVYRYVMYGNVAQYANVLGLPRHRFDLKNAKIILQVGDTYKSNANNLSFTMNEELNSNHSYSALLAPTPSSVHGLPVTGTAREGIVTTFDNNTYFPVIESWTERSVVKYRTFIGMLYIKWNGNKTDFTWTIKEVKPNEVPATKAVNYGYNMLLANPYSFTNTSTNLPVVQLDGIIPYDKGGNVIVSGRAGDEITFKVAYRYPANDLSSGTKYLVQWEIQDLSNDASTAQVLQQVRKSRAYTPGDSVEFTTNQTTYRQFTLIAKFYSKSVVDATTYESDVKDLVKLTPLATITLAFYYTNDDKKNTVRNVKAVKYDVAACSGMCTWQQRLVVWGLPTTKNTLWVSEVNDPSYFPYPNNIEIFDTAIVKCIPFKQHLLVFTETGLYQLDFAEDGLTYSSKCVQNRLSLDSNDASSVVPVQSMVLFKNGNDYSLIVPGQFGTNLQGELNIAPISKPLTELFDDISAYFKELLGTLTFSIKDWYCYLEQSQLRICYKIAHDNDYTDIVFCYDTKLRSWCVHTYKTGQYRMVQFYSSVTSDSIFVLPVTRSSSVLLEEVRVTPTIKYDSIILDVNQDPVVHCDRLLDTGNRDMDGTILVKKFRQLQFNLTVPSSEQVQFTTQFFCDNWKRKVVEYDTDSSEGTTIITPVYDESVGEDENLEYVTEWGIDPNLFPEYTVQRIKIGVNGKGRTARIILMDKNMIDFSIDKLSWVYRTMTGR